MINPQVFHTKSENLKVFPLDQKQNKGAQFQQTDNKK